MALPNENVANEIYDVLVMCGGALDSDRNGFIQTHTTKEYPCDEWRFGGHFRFGGKFYSGGWESDPWRIGYHPDDFVGDKNEEVYHSLMVAINAILIGIWEKWKRSSEFSIEAGERYSVTKDRSNFDAFVEGAEYGFSCKMCDAQIASVLKLPDAGEDAVSVELLVPSGEKVIISYVAHYGNMDVCIYAPQDGSDKRAPGAPDFAPKRCPVTCWIDKVDEKDHYISSMDPAPRMPNALHHERLATQLVLSVGPNHDLEESDGGT